MIKKLLQKSQLNYYILLNTVYDCYQTFDSETIDKILYSNCLKLSNKLYNDLKYPKLNITVQKK